MVQRIIYKTKINRAFRPVFILTALLLFSACSKESGEKKFSGSTMGTSYHITMTNPDSAVNLLDLQQDIEITLAGLNRIFSTYDPQSELSRLNGADVQQWTEVSPELFEVLEVALAVGRESDGAYDVTVAPLVDLWGFGPTETFENLPPKQAEINRIKKQVCAACIELDKSRLAVRKTRALSIDLSSIAKGYAVDKISGLIYSRLIQNYLVEIGGEVRTRGANARGEPWRLGIEKPDSILAQATTDPAQRGAPQAVVSVSGKSVATSGDYRNFITINDKRYSHIIDPATGYPVEHHPASVTVIMDDCAQADAWATAFTVLGVEQSLAIANAKNIPAYFVINDASGQLAVKMSAGFESYLVER